MHRFGGASFFAFFCLMLPEYIMLPVKFMQHKRSDCLQSPDSNIIHLVNNVWSRSEKKVTIHLQYEERSITYELS